MRRNKIQLFMILMTCMLFGGVILIGNTVEASSQYHELFRESGGKDIVKSGKYYFKYNSTDQSIYMSLNKHSGFQKTPISYNSFSDGKQAYYINKNVLYKYEYSSHKEKKIKKIKASGDQYYNISTIYGKRIFITKNSFDEWKLETYCYNLNTKKYKKVKSDCDIIAREGKYALARQDYQSDVSAHPLILYKITDKGLRKVKTLSKYSFGCRIIKGKIYYTSYTDVMMESGSLCRCNIDGTKSQILVNDAASDSQLMFMEITDKYCVIFKGDKYYKYTYSTKKFEELKNYK